MPLSEQPPQGSAAKQRPGFAGYALAPAAPKQRTGWVFKQKIQNGSQQMQIIIRSAKFGAEAILFAGLVYLGLAMPGLLSDRDSLVAPGGTQQANRPLKTKNG